MTPGCAWHRGVKILGLAIQKNFLQMFSFMIDVFTPKRISPDCPFKSNQRLTRISILTPQCAVWLCGVMHTAELDSSVSAVGCTPWSLTPRWEAHRQVFKKLLITWLGGVMHTTKLDSMEWCTLRSLTLRYDAHCGVFKKFNYLSEIETEFENT